LARRRGDFVVSNSQLLKNFVEDYHLEVGGVRFWTPYWINKPGAMAHADVHADAPYIHGPFKGKGTPGQLRSALERILATTQRRPTTPAGYRKLMRSHGLGIDCSGFAYHLLSGWLRTSHRPDLPQRLVVDRDDILLAMQERPHWRRRGVTVAPVRAWPPQTPLDLVCRSFKKSPRMLVGVAALVHPAVVVPVTRVQDIQPGDLIKTTSPRWGDHIAVVIEQAEGRLLTAESTEPAGELGGVTYSPIVITHPGKGLEHQQWGHRHLYHPGKGNDGVWRLRGLG
jgi:hypothetical protein